MDNLVNRQCSLAMLDKLPYKELKAFREDAGWAAHALPKESRGQVLWAVVSVGAQRAAVARLELARPEFCYISDFIVLRKFRRQGIGSWLLQRIEQHCLEQGIRRLVLEPLNGTQDYYRARYFIDDPRVPSYLKKEISPLQRRRFTP